MFNSTGPHYCPICEPVLNKHGKRIGEHLVLSEENYSGCGISMANCVKCGKGFSISYKVDEILHEQEWDDDPEETE